MVNSDIEGLLIMLGSSEPLAPEDCLANRSKVKLTIVVDDADVPAQMREVLGFLADQGTAKAACLLANLEGLEISGVEYSLMLQRLLALEECLFKEHVAVLASGLAKSMPQPLLNVQ